MTFDPDPFSQIFGSESIVMGITLPEAYHFALLRLNSHGRYSDCADWNTRQKELSMTMIVRAPLAEPMISRCVPCSPYELEQYRLEMLDGILDFEILNGKWPYTYHHRMTHYGAYSTSSYSSPRYFAFGEDQILFVEQELKRNPSSRRAIIDIRDNEEDMHSLDPACLQHIQFMIRDGKLDMKVLFRSNDAVKATFMNAFALIMLQERVCNLLKYDGLDISMGTYTHRANSFHCYERDFELLDAYCKRISDYYLGYSSEVTFNYKGDWQDEMQNAQPEIMQKVEELRKR